MVDQLGNPTELGIAIWMLSSSQRLRASKQVERGGTSSKLNRDICNWRVSNLLCASGFWFVGFW
ncbi:MAG: hypothetical protein KDA80_14905, partial [Planctomycetaceae bacterium]|nr:hypothetical protein [Planctomycetaceae bacterium]